MGNTKIIDTDKLEVFIMFSAIKFHAQRPGRRSILGVFFIAVVMVLMSVSANAQCSDWSAAGEWRLLQGTRGFGFDAVNLKLEQKGSTITGTASRKAMGVQGPVSGTLNGDSFSVEIAWSDGRTSVYSSRVQPSGKLQGEIHHKNSGKVNDPWYSEGELACKTLTGGRPIRSAGTGPRPSGSAPVKTGQATGSLVKTPTLVASQAVFPTPYVQQGFVVLTWDAGPGHPDADLWVKYDGSRERVLVVKQPRGGQQIPVQRGRMYSYVLMDGRTVLVTATFVAQ
jgi:hypothetical protein